MVSKKPRAIQREENKMGETPRKGLDPLRTAITVAYIDILGTKDATYNALVSDEKIWKMFDKGLEISTVFNFVEILCECDKSIYATTFSDSILLINSNFTELMPYIMTLFQISCLIREFRIRAGIEIGNAYPGEFTLKRKLPDNFTLSRYFYGDAITGAVEAERRLKGSRIILGDLLSKVIIEKKGFLTNEQSHLLISREESGRKFYEINWFDTKATETIIDQMNRIDNISDPTESLEIRIRNWLEHPNDEHSKIMLGLCYELGFI
jgi:hypothetical protein